MIRDPSIAAGGGDWRESGALTISLPPALAGLVREATARFGATPRMLAIEVLEAVFDPHQGCLGAVLDRA